MQSTQEEIYEKIANPILNNILDGFNGTIMAYGQTSSGKTHTMQGYDLSDKDNRGIMPRIVSHALVLDLEFICRH
jgi:kinesin family protein 5